MIRGVVIHALPRHPRGHDAAHRVVAAAADLRLADELAHKGGAEDASWTSSSPTAISPRAWSAAITAHVPVPHGLRSIIPVHVSGRSHSKIPFDITTAARAQPAVGAARRRPAEDQLSGPGYENSGWSTGRCSRVATLIISPSRQISRLWAASRRRPTLACRRSSTVLPTAYDDVDRDAAQLRHVDRREEVAGRRGRRRRRASS